MGCMNSASVDEQDRIKGTKILIGQLALTVEHKIAAGAYGDIWKCKDAKSGTIYAAKQIKLQTQQLQQMYNKQRLWLEKLVNCQGIVKYIGYKIIKNQKGNDKNRSQAKNIGVIVTDFYEISLYDQLKNKKLSSSEIINVLKQILLALKGLHKLGCMHLDLKPENILCKNSSNGQIIYHICDFGSCKEGPINVQSMQRREKNKLKQNFEANSTLIYRAPEMIQIGKVPITQKVDIWMLGCIIYLLLFRKHPFEGQGQLGIVTGYVDYSLVPQVTDNGDDCEKRKAKIIQCIKKMLQINIENRYQGERILQMLIF